MCRNYVQLNCVDCRSLGDEPLLMFQRAKFELRSSQDSLKKQKECNSMASRRNDGDMMNSGLNVEFTDVENCG